MTSYTEIVVPPFAQLPAIREFSESFLDLRRQVLQWLEPYYDREHLTRAGDWMLALEPNAPEYLVLAALTHDLERSVPGGPVIDKARTPWDDQTYNRAHCERSAEIVSAWFRAHGAPPEIVEGVRQPIREHEFGGSEEGDLMQAADSISFLEQNGPLVARWVLDGECSLAKGMEKLDWMRDRVRLKRAQPAVAAAHAGAVAELERLLAEAGR